MATVIRNGTVVNAAGSFMADVCIEDGLITAVGRDLTLPGDEVLDGSGCYVLPGGIDPHTHMEMPAGDLGTTADDWFSGTAAAAAGGTTSVIDMITQEPGGSLGAVLEDWERRAAAGAVADYSFHMGVIDARPETLSEMELVVAAGIPSFKIYLAYKGRIMVDDGAALRIMRQAGRLGAWTLVHAENGELIDVLIGEARASDRLHPGAHPSCRPVAGEGEATHRAIQLARVAGAPVYIVHVSCADALEAVRLARERGQLVRAEACTHHLILTEEEYQRPGFGAAPYVLSPPLRSDEHLTALWGGLSDGALDLVSSDHCPWNLKGQKDRGRQDFTLIPNGAPGVEERMALLWTYGVESRRWTVEEFVAKSSTNAARIFGLARKGAILPGYDADIVVWDPAIRRTLSVRTQISRVDHSLYEGELVAGQPRFTLSRGRTVAIGGKPVAEAGWGRFIARKSM